MIIDFHTHIFPEKIAASTIEVLKANTLKVGGRESEAYTDATADGLIKSMDKHGVDYSVVMPIATTVRQSKSINQFAAVINSMDRLFSFGSLHPMQVDWESVVYDIKEKGLSGIKLHPEYQKFYINSPESIRLLKLCERLGLLVTIHAGSDIGMDPPVHCMPEMLRQVLDYEIEGSNIIAAHMGGWREWDGVMEYLAKTPIFMDTAYITLDMEKKQFEDIVRAHGADKILFATDSPWETPGMTVEYINSTSLSNEEKEKIFSGNAKKLLKIV